MTKTRSIFLQRSVSAILSVGFLLSLLVQPFSVEAAYLNSTPSNKEYTKVCSSNHTESQHLLYWLAAAEIENDEEFENEEDHHCQQQTALAHTTFQADVHYHITRLQAKAITTHLNNTASTPLYVLHQSWKSFLI